MYFQLILKIKKWEIYIQLLLREPLEIADQHQIFEFRRHFFEKS